MSRRSLFLGAIAAASMIAWPVSHAAGADAPFVVTLKDHAFSPAVLTIPAGKKIRLIIRNEDPTPAEFESNALNREKIVAAHAEITVFIGPLKPGTYGYYDDFHKTTTTGTIEAK